MYIVKVLKGSFVCSWDNSKGSPICWVGHAGAWISRIIRIEQPCGVSVVSALESLLTELKTLLQTAHWRLLLQPTSLGDFIRCALPDDEIPMK